MASVEKDDDGEWDTQNIGCCRIRTLTKPSPTFKGKQAAWAALEADRVTE